VRRDAQRRAQGPGRVLREWRHARRRLRQVLERGIDVPCLATVVFCDARDSDFNKRQLAQRASRRYFAKPYYRVVLVIREELDDVEGLLSSFLDDDPCFRASARSGLGGGRTDSRVTLEHATDDAELISETLLTRLGTQDKVDLLVRFVTEQGRAPKQDERPDGVNIEQFLDRIRGNWRGGKVKTTLSREQMDAIEACPPWRSASPREFCPGRRKSPASSSSRRNIR
jgi:hypothetical protein